MNVEELADQWIQAWADDNIPAVGPDGDAELDWELPTNQPEKCLKVILNVLEKIPCSREDRLFGILGAGAFDILIDLHGESLLGELKRLHDSNPRFQKLFGGVVYRGINTDF